MLAGNKYETMAALSSVINWYLWFAEVIQKLPQRWKKCKDVGGTTLKKNKDILWKKITAFEGAKSFDIFRPPLITVLSSTMSIKLQRFIR